MSGFAAVVQHALSYSLVFLSVYVPALPRDNSDVAATHGPVTTDKPRAG